jgi:NADPH:quinone reductase
MKAAHIKKTGPPSNIIYGDLPVPEIGADQVLVRSKAVAINPIDTYVRAGLVPLKLPVPYIVGSDLAGTIEAVGENVSDFKSGDRVWATNQGFFGQQGVFAEFSAVDAKWLNPIPDGVEEKTAAANALVGVTAHLGLFRFGRLQAGESVFVHGGSGGVRTMVVQMAKAAGARVMTTASSEEKRTLCESLGADRVANYRTDDVNAILQEFAPEGVDVWFETLREQDLENAVANVAPRGRIIIMAGRDSKPPLPIGSFYTRNLSILGFAMFNATAEELRECGKQMNEWMADGRLHANIGRVFPLSETAEAHALQEANTLQAAGTLTGKIVLEI